MAKSNLFARLLSDGQDYRGKARYFLNLARKGLSDSVEAPANGRVPAPVAICLTRRGARLRSKTGDLAFEPETTAFQAAFRELAPSAVDLIFEGEACIDLTFSIPNGPLPDLAAIIENEIAFQSPFETATTLTFWVADEAEVGWDVTASVAMRSRVEPVLEFLAGEGVAIGAVRRKAEAGGWAARPDWIGAPAPRQMPRWVWPPMAATGVFLASLALAYLVTSTRPGADEARVAEARQALVLQAETQQSVDALNAARALSFQKVLLLGQATRGFDDKTWVQQFTLRGDKMELTGYGPSAADVSQTLSTFDGIGDVRFSSPVTRDNTQNMERFRLEARLDGALP